MPFGVGMGLTLDESALLLELEDVYWTREGLLSVQITLAVTALLASVALGLRFLRRGERIVLEPERRRRLSSRASTRAAFIRAMERGSPPPDRPDPERPTGPETPPGPQAPAPGPQAPAPTQAPGPQAPPPPPQGPPGYAPPAPESAPGYGGPVPPGGWQQPIARPEAGWVGRPLASWGSRVRRLADRLASSLLIPVVILVVVVVGGIADNDSSVWAGVGASLLYRSCSRR